MLIYVPIEQIKDNPFQKRSDYGEIAEWSPRISSRFDDAPDTRGLLQVPRGRVVFRNAAQPEGKVLDDFATFIKDGQLVKDSAIQVELAFGHRRRRAFTYLAENDERYADGLMPIMLLPLTDEQMLDDVYGENHDRKDVTAVDRAELILAKYEMVKGHGGNQRDVAESWGLARSTVSNAMRLLGLPEEVKEANRTGLLSERQCLSLAPIVQLGELADDVEWGDSVGQSWGAPVDPNEYIQHVIKRPDITSETIRDMHKRMLDHAGVKLPETIAKFDCTTAAPYHEGDFVAQPLCKGCPWRVNQHCLDASCIETKADWFAEATLQEVAEELSLPISDDLDHFKPFNNDYVARQKLQAYWEAGEREYLVVGWVYQANISAVRPFHDYPWVNREVFEGDGRAAIAIGCTKPSVLPAESGADEDAPDLADQETINEWEEQVRHIRKTAVSTAKAHMQEAISYAVADFAPLMALIQSPEAETTDDTSMLSAAFVDFLWNRGQWERVESDSIKTAVSEIEQMNQMLRRAGAEPLPELNFQERAVTWLNRWYDYRKYSWYEEILEQIATEIEALRKELDGFGVVTDSDLLQLSFELDRVAEDARVMFAEDEEEPEEKPVTYADVYSAMQTWMIHERLNDIPGQLELMLEIEEHGENHALWDDLVDSLPTNYHDGDLSTAISEKITFLEELVQEVAETAVSENEVK